MGRTKGYRMLIIATIAAGANIYWIYDTFLKMLGLRRTCARRDQLFNLFGMFQMPIMCFCVFMILMHSIGVE